MSVTGTPRMVATQTARGGSSGAGVGRSPAKRWGRRLVPTSETGGGMRASFCHAACAALGSATASTAVRKAIETVRDRGALGAR